MIMVFHAPAAQLPFPRTPTRIEDCTLVATVDTDDFGEAFAKTQHLDDAWWKNAGVLLVGMPTHRSTMVGDVLMSTKGERVLVDRCGFVPLEK